MVTNASSRSAAGSGLRSGGGDYGVPKPGRPDEPGPVTPRPPDLPPLPDFDPLPSPVVPPPDGT